MSYSGRRRPPSIIVVAPPDLPRAHQLADALYDLGWAVTLAETPADAADADAADACVVVLTRDEWRDPAITAAVRARPSMLLPVLIEPMALPSGPWTTAPIEMRSGARACAQVIVDRIETEALERSERNWSAQQRDNPHPSRPAARTPRQDTAQSRPYAAQSGSRSRIQATSGPLFVPLPPNATAKQSAVAARERGAQRRNPLARIILTILVLGGLGFSGYKGYQYYRLRNGPTQPDQSTTPYTTNVPGKGCDKNGVIWAQSPGFTYTCQPGGEVITQTASYNLTGGIAFQGSGATLAKNYSVQVDAAIQSGEPSNTVGVAVHQMRDANNILSGGQFFVIAASGLWSLQRVSADDKTNQRLSAGVMQSPSKTLTIAVTVSGATITVSVNNTLLTTVADATYSDTAAIAMIVNNSGGSNPMSALFTHFAFKPLSAAKITNADAIATATAQTALANKIPYSAAAPGPGCDQGAGQWEGPALLGFTATTTCDSGGLKVSVSGTAKPPIGRVGFLWRDGNFSQNYKIGAEVTMGSLSGGCAQILARYSASGRYIFTICDNGEWLVALALAGGQATALDNGFVYKRPTHTVEVTVNGKALTLAIDGSAISTVNDATLTATDMVAFGIQANGNDSSAIFSNFAFTPLP